MATEQQESTAGFPSRVEGWLNVWGKLFGFIVQYRISGVLPRSAVRVITEVCFFAILLHFNRLERYVYIMAEIARFRI